MVRLVFDPRGVGPEVQINAVGPQSRSDQIGGFLGERAQESASGNDRNRRA
ncbi:hypothetical protein AHiyo1_24250 [Arthrobacter sp. Hiyo1]|nr:hypothetical protein AHiyo1_24250 [Arthrobacter sp. Hiyo1]